MKTDLETIKGKRGAATDLASCASNEQKVAVAFKDIITTRITTLGGLITAFSGGGKKMSAEAKTELEKAEKAEKDANNKEPEEFYKNLIAQKAPDDKITKDVALKIKEIVEAVKKVKGSSPSETEVKALIAWEDKSAADEIKA
jgi:hypothetical protein